MKITQHTEQDVILTGWWNPTHYVPPFDVRVECIMLDGRLSRITGRQFATLDEITHNAKGVFPHFTNDDGDHVSVVLWRYSDEPSQEMLDKAIQDFEDKYDKV